MAKSRLAYKDQKETQGKASGYDILTQVKTGLVGGIINNDRQAWPGNISSVAMPLIYSANFLFLLVLKTLTTKQLVKMLSHMKKTIYQRKSKAHPIV